jgi:hypothetical protein
LPIASHFLHCPEKQMLRFQCRRPAPFIRHCLVPNFIQKPAAAVSIDMMKGNLHPSLEYLLSGLALLATIFFVGALCQSNPYSGLHTRNPGNNPNKFFLWATNSSYCYTFTYDPHAADVWRFESGGGYGSSTFVTASAAPLRPGSNSIPSSLLNGRILAPPP